MGAAPYPACDATYEGAEDDAQDEPAPAVGRPRRGAATDRGTNGRAAAFMLAVTGGAGAATRMGCTGVHGCTDDARAGTATGAGWWLLARLRRSSCAGPLWKALEETGSSTPASWRLRPPMAMGGARDEATAGTNGGDRVKAPSTSVAGEAGPSLGCVAPQAAGTAAPALAPAAAATAGAVTTGAGTGTGSGAGSGAALERGGCAVDDDADTTAAARAAGRVEALLGARTTGPAVVAALAAAEAEAEVGCACRPGLPR